MNVTILQCCQGNTSVLVENRAVACMCVQELDTNIFKWGEIYCISKMKLIFSGQLLGVRQCRRFSELFPITLRTYINFSLFDRLFNYKFPSDFNQTWYISALDQCASDIIPIR